MKKTILALAIPAALVATAANAGVTVYENDATAVQLSGAVEVQYYQKATKAVDSELRIDDGALAIDAAHVINDNLTAFAGLSFIVGEDQNPNGGVTTDGTFVGLSSNFGALSFGRQYLYIDDIGAGVEIELKDAGAISVDLNDQTTSSDTIKYGYQGDNFFVGADYVANQNEGKAKGFDVKAGYDILDNLNLTGYYADFDSAQDTAANVAQKSYQVELRYTLDALYVGASFGNVDKSGAANVDLNSYEVAAAYTLGQNTFGLGYAYTDGTQEANTDYKASSVYGNIVRALNDNVNVYAEVSLEDVKGDAAIDNELGYVAGMEVTF
ncbi:Porin-like protein H [Vibrio stylophorae]|uniref:Porin-like protein H n=1 Tax=Vibrio stylophorae TaxID=659351 RepID=A0ABN8DVG5_9VIBR|nr:porin [Vibrio stylophorae]CAH0533910.1 Porin-like protein H [Vibrio stylophorae]